MTSLYLKSEELFINNNQFDKQKKYILQHSDSSLFHSIFFAKIIKKDYDIDSYLITFYKNNVICGVVILYKCPVFPFGFKLTDLLFSGSYGGILCDKDVSKTNLLELLKKHYLTNLTIELKLSKNDYPDLDLDNLFYVNYKLNLNESIDDIWLNKVDQKARNQVRKSYKNNLNFSILGVEGLDVFYEIYIKTMKGLGSPSLSYEFFKNISIAFPGDIKISIVKYDNTPISALFNVISSSKVHNVWAGSLHEYRKYCPNYMNYWELIKWTKEQGIKEFDFGRSILRSTHENFKKQWGAKKIELFYFDLLKNEHANVINPKSNEVLLFIKIWNILPFPITKLFDRFFVKRTG